MINKDMINDLRIKMACSFLIDFVPITPDFASLDLVSKYSLSVSGLLCSNWVLCISRWISQMNDPKTTELQRHLSTYGND